MLVNAQRFPIDMVHGKTSIGAKRLDPSKTDLVSAVKYTHHSNDGGQISVSPSKAANRTSSAQTGFRRLLNTVKNRRKEKESPNASSPQDETKLYLSDTYTQEQLIDAELSWEQLVELPAGTDLHEWLATHTISFFEHVNLLYGTVSEYCTSSECTSMLGPSNTQYQWIDEKGKKCKCTAPQYVDYVMTYVQKTVEDETFFPTKYGNAFPSSMESTVRKIQRLLLHVIAHLYQCHFKELVFMRMHPHLNTVFIHFVTFCRRFALVEDRELEVLDDLVRKLVQRPHTRSTSSATLDNTEDKENHVSDSQQQIVMV